MKFSRVLAGMVAMSTAAIAARCAPIQSQSRQVDAQTAVTSLPPTLASVSPDSVVLPYGGTAAVTLTGSGFVPGQPGTNTVHFNNAVFTSVAASADGKRIVFNIPDVVSSGGGAPPLTLAPGRYMLSVETNAGTSNAVAVRVYR